MRGELTVKLKSASEKGESGTTRKKRRARTADAQKKATRVPVKSKVFGPGEQGSLTVPEK